MLRTALLVALLSACSSGTSNPATANSGSSGSSTGGSSGNTASGGAAAGIAGIATSAGTSSGGDGSGGATAGSCGQATAGSENGGSSSAGMAPSAYDACMKTTLAWEPLIEKCETELPGHLDSLTVPAVKCAAVADSVSAGRVKYDPSKLQGCLDQISKVTCADWYGNKVPQCDALVGTVAGGGECHTYSDCNAGQCNLFASCPSTCLAYVDVNGPCDGKTKLCNPSTTRCDADTLTCVPYNYVDLGGVCNGNAAYCNRAVAYCDGTNHCAPLKTSGACEYSFECATGYVCAGPQKGTACQQAVGLGGSCTPGYEQCIYPGACDASTHTCVERKVNDPCGQLNLPENQTCVEGSCVYDTNTTGTCVAFRKDGETCGAQGMANCGAASYCRNGICSPIACP